jgi:hypothetical protein
VAAFRSWFIDKKIAIKGQKEKRRFSRRLALFSLCRSSVRIRSDKYAP